MDKHQSARTLLHENDSFGNIIEILADLFHLSADTKRKKNGNNFFFAIILFLKHTQLHHKPRITAEIKKEVGTT